MRKIPTLFKRDPDNMRHVLPEVHPDCWWVLDGEGVATRKYDGTCLLFDGSVWWARREVKPGKQEPPGFVAVEHDENTGVAEHLLVRHGYRAQVDRDELNEADVLTFEGLREWLLGHLDWEGIVWHHPDGRMAKLKRRDFQ